MNNRFTGGPDGGNLEIRTVKKTIFWIIIAIVSVMLLILKPTSKTFDGAESKPSNNQAITENIIHLTTNWSEWVEPGYDQRLVSHMKTPNLYWEVLVKYVGGKEVVYKRFPINYSESDNLKLTNPVESFRWRITPAEVEPLQKGKLEGEVHWHREPKK
jgi:hypothetical protein